jgi:putative ABC transport system permease protein
VNTLATLIYQEAFVFAYMAALMGIFGLVALGLSATGVYGVMSYVVSQQQHEIGVRMALGAPRGSVLAMLLRRGMRTAAIGLLIGAIPAYGLARLMRATVWGVTLRDPATFVAIPLGLLAAAALAIYFPARRGTRIDPILALGDE